MNFFISLYIMKTPDELQRLEDEAYDRFISNKQYEEQYLNAPDKDLYTFSEWLDVHFNIKN